MLHSAEFPIFHINIGSKIRTDIMVWPDFATFNHHDESDDINNGNDKNL